MDRDRLRRLPPVGAVLEDEALRETCARFGPRRRGSRGQGGDRGSAHRTSRWNGAARRPEKPGAAVAGDPRAGASAAQAGSERDRDLAPYRPGPRSAGGGGRSGRGPDRRRLLQSGDRPPGGRARPAHRRNREACVRAHRRRGRDRRQQQRRCHGAGASCTRGWQGSDRVARAARGDRRRLPAAGDLRSLGRPPLRSRHDQQDPPARL